MSYRGGVFINTQGPSVVTMDPLGMSNYKPQYQCTSIEEVVLATLKEASLIAASYTFPKGKGSDYHYQYLTGQLANSLAYIREQSRGVFDRFSVEPVVSHSLHTVGKTKELRWYNKKGEVLGVEQFHAMTNLIPSVGRYKQRQGLAFVTLTLEGSYECAVLNERHQRVVYNPRHYFFPIYLFEV